jgi:hypothetical protein
MTLQEYLAAEGLSQEEIAAIVGNEKQAKAMTKALGLADEGRSALAAAKAEKDETSQFWETKTKELQGSVERLTKAEKRAAEAEAAAASRAAYLKSLADQGYDVPKQMYDGAPTVDPNAPRDPDTGKYLTREDANKLMRGTAPDLVTLISLSNEYQHLYGSPYLSADADFAEAQRAGKPMRDFVRGKYNFEGKRTELATKADQERIDKIVNERVTAEKAKLAEQYGSNPETRAPMPSKFDRLEKTPGFKSDSWKSPDGRKANREARLKRFENVTLQ